MGYGSVNTGPSSPGFPTIGSKGSNTYSYGNYNKVSSPGGASQEGMPKSYMGGNSKPVGYGFSGGSGPVGGRHGY